MAPGRIERHLVRLVLAAAFALGSSGLRASEPRNEDRSDGSTLRAVLAKIDSQYVDQTRIDPGRMLWAAAAALDREIPEALLESAPGSETLAFRVGGERRTFQAGSVRSTARLGETLREILRFVNDHQAASDDRAAAEYVAVNGILSTLDPHSVILDPAQARAFSSQVQNRISGVGMVIDFRQTPPAVQSLLKGGSAGAGGVKACDRILAIEGRTTAGASIDEVVGRLVGPTGTDVWVTFERDGTGLREMILTRRQIDLPSVSSRLLEGGVGCILVNSFGRGTAAEVETALGELAKAGATAWILDLRPNPGGLLSEAVATVALFVSGGPVVTTVADRGRSRETRLATRKSAGPVEDGPLAVLISPWSASSAEVVVGALQNRNRAVVLGQTSFGKGSVQVLFDNPDGSKLKLTVAHYVTPGGFSLQSRGVVPDVELVPVPAPRPGRVRLSEADFEREASLERAFAEHDLPKTAAAPQVTLRYMASLPDHEEEVAIARDLLLDLGPARATRTDALTRASAFLRDRRETEEKRILSALSNAGVDWTSGESGNRAKVAVRCSQRAGAAGTSAERVLLDCEVANDGEADAFRVHGRAPGYAFDLGSEEIVVGRVAAGSRRTVTLDAELAKDPAARTTRVSFAFTQQGGAAVESPPVRIERPARSPAAGAERAPGPDVRLEREPLETAATTWRILAAVADRAAVRDAWVRVSNRQARLDRKKAAYLARPEGSPPDRMDLSADVPLAPGLNEVEVCARSAAGQRCDTAYVFRQ